MQTICFIDIDGTLVENRFSRKALGALFDEIHRATHIPIMDLVRQMGAENERRQVTDPDNLLTMDWDDIIEGIARQHGVALSRKGIDLWNEYAALDGIEVLDNALGVLDQLKQAGYGLVIATKGLSKYQDSILDLTGLRAYFDDILTPDITGYLKTTPAYFNKYYQLAQRQALRFVHIGDHYYDDVMCPVRNGFFSILRAPYAELRPYDPFERVNQLEQIFAKLNTYPKQGTDVRPHAVVTSLEELPAVLERLPQRTYFT